MCGFFSFSTGFSPREIADILGIDNLPRNERDIEIFKNEIESFKFYPKSKIPTVSKNSPNQLIMRYWSIIPRWWKENPADIRFSTFNARAEEIREKATFRTPWKLGQRCLVPATWFYEFKAEEISPKKIIKVPYRVQSTEDEIFTIAGLYEIWKSKEGDEVQSVSLITCESVPPLLDVHHRQPVIIKQMDREKWLDKRTSEEEAFAMLKPTMNLELFQIDQTFNKTFGSNVTREMVSRLNSQ
jgi:putative SOS response-associated peptidase YedK